MGSEMCIRDRPSTALSSLPACYLSPSLVSIHFPLSFSLSLSTPSLPVLLSAFYPVEREGERGGERESPRGEARPPRPPFLTLTPSHHVHRSGRQNVRRTCLLTRTLVYRPRR